MAPQPGVVLLRNGQILSGRISQAGEEYYVALDSGEIRLRANQVELICRDLAEGYERKRGRIDPDKLGDHLDLALWCIRQGMYDNAAREIADARQIDPRHPRIALIERQFKLAKEQPSSARQKPATGEPSPTNEDLDRLVRGMPPGTVETFATAIQPLLLNTCATGGCHGPQSESKLRLLRTQVGKTSSRRLTQRNLYAVLDTIDRNDPPASPLLTAPVIPHGTAKSAIFTNKEVVQYRQLLQWVMRVSRSGQSEQPTSVDTPEDHLSQRLPRTVRPSSAPTPNALFATSGESKPTSAASGTTRAEIMKAGDKKALRAETTTSADPPGDPFDPQLFNERFATPQ